MRENEEKALLSLVEADEYTDVDSLENARAVGELICDGDFAHIRMFREDDLIYHVFRGPKVHERYWGTGEFGLDVLSSIESIWPSDFPNVDFDINAVRLEVYADEIDKRSKYPDHYYGAYLVAVRNIHLKPVLSTRKIRQFGEILELNVEKRMEIWLRNLVSQY